MRIHSLKSSAEFDFVYKNGMRFFHKHFTLYALNQASLKQFVTSNAIFTQSKHTNTHRIAKQKQISYIKDILEIIDSQYICVGLSISRKVGKAHIRNLLKRRIRAILYESLQTALLCVIVPKPSITELTFQQLKQNLLFGINKLKNTHHQNTALNKNIQKTKRYKSHPQNINLAKSCFK